MKVVTVAPAADQNSRLAAVWSVLAVAEREYRLRYIATLEKAETILRAQSDDRLADALARAREELVA